MAKKPQMLRDDFTDKYFEESHDHNKDLFNPNRTVMRDSSRSLPGIKTMSQTGISRNDHNRNMRTEAPPSTLIKDNFVENYPKIIVSDIESVDERSSINGRKSSAYMPKRF